MAHPKETPRQKMIGMMYLVLMAMLALNVAREVLDAFVLIDESLVKTTENFYNKNEDSYFLFEQAAAEMPAKAKPWLDKAVEVKRRANELYENIQRLKLKIVTTSEGEDTEAIEDGNILGGLIEGKDDTMVPAEIMIGAARDGEAFALKGEIEGFREYLLSLISEEATTTRQSIQGSLDTSDPKTSGHKHQGELPPTWESHHFEEMPLIAVISLMSKLQSDVRNAESDAIRYLYSQIEAGSFKFNKIDPVVIANSDYITRGNEYKAEVFMAAFDTTQKPIVYVGEYDSTITDQGIVEYYMKGTLGQDYDSIPVSGGKGVYSIQTSSNGEKKWGGIISLKRLDGSYSSKPFTRSYTVTPPSLVVSPTKMNVFYLGVDNPVEVSVPGYPANAVRATMTNGRLRQSGSGYIANPTKEGSCDVRVSVEVDGTTRSMGTKPFRVRPVPDPYPTLAGVRGGTVAKSQVVRQLGPEASMPDWFEFDLEFKIVSFTVGAQFQGLFRREFSNSGNFTSPQREILLNSTSGSIIYITDIKAVGPDGRTRDIGAMTIQYQ
jgi:gliding motility-associated protein GldM